MDNSINRIILLDGNVLRDIARGSKQTAQLLITALQDPRTQVYIGTAQTHELTSWMPDQKLGEQYAEVLNDLKERYGVVEAPKAGTTESRVNMLLLNDRHKQQTIQVGKQTLQTKGPFNTDKTDERADLGLAVQADAIKKDNRGLSVEIWTHDENFEKKARAQNYNMAPEVYKFNKGSTNIKEDTNYLRRLLRLRRRPIDPFGRLIKPGAPAVTHINVSGQSIKIGTNVRIAGIAKSVFLNSAKMMGVGVFLNWLGGKLNQEEKMRQLSAVIGKNNSEIVDAIEERKLEILELLASGKKAFALFRVRRKVSRENEPDGVGRFEVDLSPGFEWVGFEAIATTAPDSDEHFEDQTSTALGLNVRTYYRILSFPVEYDESEIKLYRAFKEKINELELEILESKVSFPEETHELEMECWDVRKALFLALLEGAK